MRSRTPWRVTALLGAVAIAAAIVGAPANARAHLGSRAARVRRREDTLDAAQAAFL